MELTFFLADEPDVEALSSLDPDRDWRELQLGERAWVLQTYLRLARAGHPVRLSSTLPQKGMVVFHSKHRRALMRERHRMRDVVLVGVRADNREPLIADFEVVQNGRFADDRRRFFIPHWPQPGLIPRDPARGAAVSRIAYKGFDGNLDSAFRSPAWSGFLAENGIDWVVDSVEFAGRATDRFALEWPDFRTVDLVLAVRPRGRRRRLETSKPATKLVNAWIAGVPAILGPELAFRELRRSELDYLEVSSLDEARAAVRRLLEDPDLYRAMVENGRRRAAELTGEALLQQWRSLLYERIPALAATPRGRLARRVPLPVKVPARWLARLLTLRPAR